ncbi:hypothetical protein SAMN05444920_10372 [Nonomuraea solani]|uniref:Uncharacterized protein n=1 Tax=Nonomuraea solani TaxID=1144553 RepID=A0A1H6B2R6_9ACTN|nr:hypothetical protein SAMN05444920_10372 [Nonomuraea solani]
MPLVQSLGWGLLVPISEYGLLVSLPEWGLLVLSSG